MADAQFSLDVLLPDLPDAQDACVSRLRMLVAAHEGVSLAHTTTDGRSICIHFDPSRITLSEVERLVKAAGADLARQYGHVSIPLEGALEEDAGRDIEDLLRQQAGVIEVSASVSAGRVRVEFDRRVIDSERIVRAIQEVGYRVSPRAPTGLAPWVDWYRRNRELVWSLCAALLLASAWSGQRFGGWPRLASIPLYLAAYAFGAWDLLRHTVARVQRGVFTFDIDLLMLLAALGAATLGEWADGAFLLALFAFAHALEHYAMDRARGATRALSELAPARARVRRDGSDVEVPIEQVQIGEIVLVRPGDRIPVDGLVASGTSAVNQAPVTGESVPVDKGDGDEVFAGAVNGEGALEVRSTRAAGDRTLDRVIKLVEDAQTSKAGSCSLQNRPRTLATARRVSSLDC
jgi:Cd2+/Zn2+-exporting ATPase